MTESQIQDAPITPAQAEILRHTRRTGRYVTSVPAVLQMADAGLLIDHGPQALAGGDHYLVISRLGASKLDEWQAAQPKPKKRRKSESFDAWERYCDAFNRVSFSHFWGEIWPTYPWK